MRPAEVAPVARGFPGPTRRTTVELHGSPDGDAGTDLARRRHGYLACLAGIVALGSVALYTALRPIDGDAAAVVVLWAIGALAVFVLAWQMFATSEDLRFVRILCIVAWAYAIAGLVMVNAPAPFLAGRIASQVAIAGFIYVTLSYPNGRISWSSELGFFGVAAAGMGVLLLVNVLLATVVPPPGPLLRCGAAACPRNPLVLDALGPAEGHRLAQALAVWSGASLLVAAGMTANRAREYSARERAVFATATTWMAALCAGGGTLMVIRGVTDRPVLTPLSIIGTAALALTPVAQAIAFLRGRAMASSSLHQILSRIEDGVGLAVVQDALARAFADPDLRLLVRQPGGGSFVDAHGAPADPARIGSGRELTELTREGQPAAILVHDRLPENDRGELEAAGAAVLLTLDNIRLQADLQRSVQELRRSRRRVAEAVHQERARIERDLHDGAQQFLIAIGHRISRLRTARGDDPAISEDLTRAAEEIERALEEVRELTHGIYPSTLRILGLGPALKTLVRGAPMPVTTTLACERRFEPLVEAAVYFCCSEALQNVAKHCPAPVSVTLRMAADDDGITFELADDGPGFDVTAAIASSGLAGMRDRINAVGGELYIHTTPGTGTTVTGAIPTDELSRPGGFTPVG